jgi:ectoine utilization protein EutC
MQNKIPEILFLREAELRKLVDLDQTSLASVEAAFTSLAAGNAEVPMPMHINVEEHHGELDVKSACIRGLDAFAIKIAAGFYDNKELGLPTSSGMMILINAKTGFPIALLLDNGYLTQVRTGLAGAIAAKYLAPKKIERVGIIGAGTQGRFQLRALQLVREFQRVLIFDRNVESAERYVGEVSAALKIRVERAESASELVQKSDVVVTSTPSRVPIVTASCLHKGLHITAMGADGPGKQELDPTIFGQADRVVCDRKAQCVRIGELQHAFRHGILTEHSEIVELGEITSGAKVGRRDDTEITVCDLTGVGVQDTAIAVLAYSLALKAQVGSMFDPSSAKAGCPPS